MKKPIITACSLLAFSNPVFAQNVVISNNLTTAEDISASNITINNSATLNLLENNNSVFASSINIDANSKLIIGTGTIMSGIFGVSDNVGKIEFGANNHLLANVGSSTKTIAEIEIAKAATLIMGSRNIDSSKIILNEGTVLSYGSGTILGEVDGKVAGLGQFVFNNTKTTSFSIGNHNLLANIDVIDGTTVTLGGNIAAKNINIGSESSGKIKSNGKNIFAEHINLGNGAILEIDAQGTVVGKINGAGTLQFSGSNPMNWQLSVGEKNKLSQILVSNETVVNLNNQVAINADNITIGEGSSGGIGIPILNQNSGSLGIDNSSLIRLNSDAIFNYNGGTINGAIRGTSSNKGTFNVNHDYVSNSTIGQSFALANLNIAQGVKLTANSNISANKINVLGVLDLGNSSKTISGNISASSGSITDLGSTNHVIKGDFAIASQGILKITAFDNSNIGSLSASGNVNISGDTDLQIYFDSSDGYLSDGSKTKIISGSSGLVNSISDSNINVNNLGLNKSGIFTFRTEVSESDLFLVVDKKDASDFTNSKIAQNIYLVVDKIGSFAQKEMRDLQRLIDDQSTTDLQRDSVFKSIIPQNNDQINNSAINSVLSVVSVVNSRLDNVMLGINSNQNLSHNFTQNSFRNFGNLNFDNEIFDDQAIWIQGFNSSAFKKNSDENNGYDYKTQGIVVGVDQEIAKNLRLGVSSGFSEAIVDSTSNNQKQTNINSYQFNLYGGYVFDSYFVSGIVGASINKYSAIRLMPQMNLSSAANYNGQTYIAKFEGGINQKFASGFFIVPKLTLTAAKNQVATYSENGAGTLNLTISNEHNNFLEPRIGFDFGYDDLKISEFNFRPKIKLSYGYNLLAQDQSSKNNFEGQKETFVISSPVNDRESLKYFFGCDFYDNDSILVSLEYGIEKKKDYESKTSSIYFRYRL